MTYRAFLPADVPTGKKLSVVYVLHGAGIGYPDWSNHSDVSQFAREGAILVMPEGGPSYYMNAVESPKDKYEDYITKDLIADVEGRFPTRRDRGGRAVVGIRWAGLQLSIMRLYIRIYMRLLAH